jgi:hypothetical protein
MPADAALRMACVWWRQDPHAALTPPQRDWLTVRLARATPLTEQETAKLAPALIAWATARHPQLGRVVAQCCDRAPREVDPQRSGLAILRQYPGPSPEPDATNTPLSSLK